MANAPQKNSAPIFARTETIRLSRDDIHPPDQDIMLTSQPEDKYSPLESVGEGAMKAVLKMHDRDAARNIAMAVMLDDNDEEAYYRFLQEARITANLEHPNIVPVHEIGMDREGHLYFTMKLISGESLGKIIDKLDAGDKDYRSNYRLHQLLGIFRKVCDAVSFAHARGVIHLDLKPDNIQVGHYGEVLVLDWGLARFIGDSAESAPKSPGTNSRSFRKSGVELTLDGIAKGTPGYMAPEQAAGRNNEKDQRTDIYALGAILYTILTWKWPIEGKDIQKMLRDTIKGKIVPPKTRTPNRNIPQSLEAVAMKAMSLDPNERYQSTEELSKDIDSFLSGFATSAERGKLFTQIWLLLKRNKGVSSVLAASAAIFIIVIWNFMLGITDAKNHALQNEKKALIALEILQKEQEERQKLAKSAAPRFVAEAKKFFETGDDDDAKKELKNAFSLDKDCEPAWLLQGRLLLAEERFADAYNALLKVKSPDAEKHRKIAKEYAVLVRDEERNLTVAERSKLGKQIDKIGDIALAARLVKNANPDKAALNSRIDAAFLAIKQLNPSEKNPRLSSRIYESGTSYNLVVDISGNSHITNISPLKDIPINELLMQGSSVSDISALKGMPLRRLYAPSSKISDISALKGMPLQELMLQSTFVEDLSPLLDMQLKILSVSGCAKISDMSALRNMPLESLDISGTAITDLSLLKSFPIIRLGIGGLKAADISVLERLKLRDLNAASTSLADLSVLKNMPLENLFLEATEVSDLSPLSGKQLLSLRLSDTPVSDLGPLKGMPIKSLYVARCKNLKDLSPLKELPLLEELMLPPDTGNIEFLRNKPGLAKISLGGATPGPAADFWRKWDARQKNETVK